MLTRLATSTISLSNRRKQNLYTVPANQICVPAFLVPRKVSTKRLTSAGILISGGFNAGGDDQFAPNGSIKAIDTPVVGNTGDVFGATVHTNGTETDANIVVDFYGYLFPAD